jgi:hypothetical protein
METDATMTPARQILPGGGTVYLKLIKPGRWSCAKSVALIGV